MSVQKFIVHLDKLQEIEDNNEVEKGDLELLSENFKKATECVLTTLPKIVMVVDNLQGKIFIDGISVDKFDTLPTGFPEEEDKGIYSHVKLALAQAQEKGIFDTIFQKVEESGV